MKIYLAASFDSKASMREHRTLAESFGHKVTSTWIDLPDDMPLMSDRLDCEKGQVARGDLNDIDQAQALVYFAGGSTTTGGKNIELGYALAKGMRIILVGDKSSVFHYLGSIEAAPSVSAAFRYLQSKEAVANAKNQL